MISVFSMSGAGIRLFLVICLLSAATFADACDEKACKLISSFMKMLQSIVDSPSFSCYRNEKMTSDGTVTYDGCYVDATNGEMSQWSPKVSCENLVFDF